MSDRVEGRANPLTGWLAARFEEVGPAGFYRELFPSGSLAKGPGEEGYGAVCLRVWRDDDGEHAGRVPVWDGLEELGHLLAIDPAMGVTDIVSPVSYAGRRPRLDRAHALYSLTFDLDGLVMDDRGDGPAGIVDLFYQMGPAEHRGPLLPRPTFTVSSGTGLHLYYLLDEPIRMWPDVCERLSAFREALTRRLWNQYVTDLSREAQMEGVVQGFRAVGSLTKSRDQLARAFRTGGRVTMAEMDSFVPEDARVSPLTGRRRSLPEARALWPEWDPDWRRKATLAPHSPWRVKRALFDWWCRRVESGEPFEGNRYWCVWVAACLAAKCPEVSFEELEAWAYSVRPRLDEKTARPGNEFTEEDVAGALAAYGNPVSVKLRRDKIAEKTRLPMPVNKRNGRSLEQHVKMINALRKMRRDVLGEDEYRKSGRPKGSGTKRDEIRSYASEHPEASHSEIARALGVSRPTVIKWLRTNSGEG